MALPERKQLDHSQHIAARFGADFFITICCQQRGINQLCKPDSSEILLDTACIYHETSRWHLHLLLLMPDHLHAIIGVAGETDLRDLIRDYKRVTARRASIQWQRNFFDHRLRHDESLAEKSNYILQNPVRAGFVQTPESWNYVIHGDATGTWGNKPFE